MRKKREKKIKEKLILLVGVVFSLVLPVFVDAAILKVGDNEYDSLTEAIDDASISGNEILLNEDLKLDPNSLSSNAYVVTIANNQKIVLNLNGKKITGNFVLKNLGDLTIKNGSLITEELSGGGLINNADNAILSINSLEVQTSNSSAPIIKNSGTANIIEMKTTEQSKASTQLKNTETGIMILDKCDLHSVYDLITNEGTLTIKDGNYSTNSNIGINSITGKLIIDNGNFETKGKAFMFEATNNGNIIVNNGSFKGYSAFKSNCSNDFKCNIEIKNGSFDNTSDIFVVTGGNGSIIVNDGEFTTSTTNYLFHGTGGDGSITILGGKFIATNAESISDFGQGNLQLTLGTKDNDAKNVPYILMPNGKFSISDKLGSKLYYYDGILIMKNVENKINGLSLAEIEENYKVCYTQYSDTALKAYLSTSCEVVKTLNASNENENNTTEDTKKDDVDNPQTGEHISAIIMFFLLISMILILLYTKKNKLYKI